MTDQETIQVRQHAVTSVVTLYDGSAKPISVIMEAVKIIEEHVLEGLSVPAPAPRKARAAKASK